MRLLEEMRNLDVGDPGRWSARVSVVLACCLFLLIAGPGLRLRVFGQLAPRLEEARADAAELERQLALARKDARAMRTIGEEADEAEELLRASGAWIPSQAPDLDLPVALTKGQSGMPLQSVRSWETPTDLSPHLRPAGAELDLGGSYAELAAYLDSALDSMQLRELIELSIESPGPENPGLRASARLVAYYGGSGAAELLRIKPEEPARLQFSEYPRLLADAPSPFAVQAAVADTGVETQGENPPAALRRHGFVRVGTQRYELVQDAAGKLIRRSGE